MSNKKKKFIVVNGSRSNHGLLKRILKKLKRIFIWSQDRSNKLYVNKKLWKHYKKIKKDGLNIDMKIKVHLRNDSQSDLIKL